MHDLFYAKTLGCDQIRESHCSASWIRLVLACMHCFCMVRCLCIGEGALLCQLNLGGLEVGTCYRFIVYVVDST
jgi:hypothetical protein